MNAKFMTKLRTHYDNLKVARDAPDVVIRAAYKVLVQKYHPDKNSGDARTGRVMQIINQSYGVLSDPARRREHDAWIKEQETVVEDAWEEPPEPPRPPPKPKPQEAPIPPQWQQPDVGSVSPNVLSAIMAWPFRLLWRIASAVPQLTLLALLFGGIWLWGALTPDKPPPPGPKPYQAKAPTHPAQMPLAKDECRPIPYRYMSNGREVVGTVYGYMQEDGTRNYVVEKPAACEGTANTTASTSDTKPAQYSRPANAPNGSAWPVRAAYVKGYPIDNDSGYSEVTVDNAQNDADVFVKLVSLDAATAFPVRQFYIPAGASFTMNKVTAGRYDLRYRDLDTGGLSRSEAFDVEETRTDDGVQYSSLTMTLYKVQDGNFQTYDLAADEF